MLGLHLYLSPSESVEIVLDSCGLPRKSCRLVVKDQCRALFNLWWCLEVIRLWCVSVPLDESVFLLLWFGLFFVLDLDITVISGIIPTALQCTGHSTLPWSRLLPLVSLWTECAPFYLFCLLFLSHSLNFLCLGRQPKLCSLGDVKCWLILSIVLFGTFVCLRCWPVRRLLMLWLARFPILWLSNSTVASGDPNLYVVFELLWACTRRYAKMTGLLVLHRLSVLLLHVAEFLSHLFEDCLVE